MKHKIFFLSLAIALLADGCTKDETVVSTTVPQTSVSLTNVNGSAKSLDIYIDGQKKTTVGLGVNSTVNGIYVGLTDAPTHNIVINDAANGAVELYNNTFNTEKGQSYTFFAYDTIKLGKINGILLKSDRTIAADNVSTSGVRFLNFSLKSPPLDLWLVRRVGGVAKDSSMLGPRPYLGGVASPDVNALSIFTSVKSSEVAGSAGVGVASSDYLFRLKLAGTNTIVSTSSATLLIPARNYTIFARGTYPASAITILLNN